MDEKMLGSCLCGEVSFKIGCTIDSFFLCHCKFCQKDTGSAHAANLFCRNSNFNWLSGEELVKSFHLPSTRHTKSFCSNCGSAVPSVQRELKFVVVPAGSLDSPLNLKPNAHLFMSSKANWEKNLGELQMFEELPT